LFNISFEDIDLTVPAGSEPFTAMQLSYINGLRLENVRFFERDESNGSSPFAINLENIENGIYKNCLPIPKGYFPKEKTTDDQ